jgi:hypothetical protein
VEYCILEFPELSVIVHFAAVASPEQMHYEDGFFNAFNQSVIW